MARRTNELQAMRTTKSFWPWRIAMAASLISLGLSCLQTAMAEELLPSIADDRLGSEASGVSSPLPELTAPWPARPLMEGNWQDLPLDQFSKVMQKLRNHRYMLSQYEIKRNEWPVPVEPSRLRRLVLPCYDNVALIEAEVQKTGDQPGVLTFLLHDRGGALLNGRRGVEQIIQLNKWNPPQLTTPEQAAAYLKFMIGTADPGDGNFRVLEEAHSVDWKTDEDRTAHADLEQAIRPVTMTKQEHDWIGEAIIQYKAELSRVKLSLSPKGQPNMLDEQPLGSDLPIKVRRFSDWVRYDAW